jgi:trehalose-phosphatase
MYVMNVLSSEAEPEQFLSRVRRGLAPRVLLLDYDGTLAPFTAKRLEAVPYEGVRARLARVYDRGETRVVFVSGRPVGELLQLLGMPDRAHEVWGSHGWQHLRPDGTLEQFSLESAREAGLREAQALLRRELGHDSPAIEVKPTSVALHWRGGREPPRLRGLWQDLARSSGLELHDFDGGLELRAPGRDKGDAVRAVLASSPAGALTAYLGDDLTDEDAFCALGAAAPRQNRLSVLVRPELRRTAADLWVRPPRELMDLLDAWGGERKDHVRG